MPKRRGFHLSLSIDVTFMLQVVVAALQNLVKIMSLYYPYMESYMGPALFAVSIALFSLFKMPFR